MTLLSGLHLVAFFASALALLLIPGPAVLYIVAKSVDQGTRAGVTAVAGIACGGLLHLCAAVLGLSALVAASVTAFNTVRFAGAAYLIYLGVAKLRERPNEEAPSADAKAQLPLRRLFWQGFTVQALNPKIAFFFLAFLPQFIDAGRGRIGAQVLAIGALFLVMGFLTDSTYALVAGQLGARLRLRNTRRLARIQRRVTAAVYISLGIFAGVSSAPGRRHPAG